MRNGMSYTTVLMLQPEPQSKQQKQLRSDLLEKIVITLTELTEEIMSKAQHPIAGQQPLLAVKRAITNNTGVPTVDIDTDVQASTTLGGSVQVQNHLDEMLSVTMTLVNYSTNTAHQNLPHINATNATQASTAETYSSITSRTWTTMLTTVQANASTTAMTKQLKQANRRSNAK